MQEARYPKCICNAVLSFQPTFEFILYYSQMLLSECDWYKSIIRPLDKVRRIKLTQVEAWSIKPSFVKQVRREKTAEAANFFKGPWV